MAINPNRRLLSAIKDDRKLRSKISIIVERKDLVYRLSPDVEILDI